MKLPQIIRCLMTITLLYFVYQETGWATTLCLFLSAIANELIGFELSKKVTSSKFL